MTHQQTASSSRLLSTKEAAAYCGLASTQSLYNLISQGEGPTYFKHGRRSAFYEADLDEWNRARLVPASRTRA